MASPSYLAVLMDLDGTLTAVDSFWRHLHESLALRPGDAELSERRFEAGEIDYETFCRLDASRWRGRRVGELKRIADAIMLRPGARVFRRYLGGRGLKVGVISTGLTLLAERIHRDLKLDFTIANRLVVRRGYLTGDVKINVVHGHKEEAVDLFSHQFGIPPRRIIGIGNSVGDISMFRAVGYSVAFNPSGEEVARAATAVCAGNRLTDLVFHLPLERHADPGGVH